MENPPLRTQEQELAIKNHWTDVAAEIKKTWSKLDLAALDKTKGDVGKIRELILLHYGRLAHTEEQRLTAILQRFEVQLDRERLISEQPQHPDAAAQKQKKPDPTRPEAQVVS